LGGFGNLYSFKYASCLDFFGLVNYSFEKIIGGVRYNNWEVSFILPVFMSLPSRQDIFKVYHPKYHLGGNLYGVAVLLIVGHHNGAPTFVVRTIILKGGKAG